jgi:hypothetical protein
VRRLLAAIAAVVMLFAGYAIYLIRTDSKLPWESSSSRDTTAGDTKADGTNGPVNVPESTIRFNVSCVSEAEQACASADNVGESAFTIEFPQSTEKAYGDKKPDAPDAWLTTSLSYQRVSLVRPDLRLAGTLASSRIMVVTKAAAINPAVKCAAKLSCLAKAGRVAFPAKTTGAGLWVATSTLMSAIAAGEQPATIDDITDGSAVLQGLNAAKKLSPTNALSNLTSVSLLDAVVLPEASLRSVAPSGVNAVPAADTPPIAFVLIVSKKVTDKQAKQISASLTKSLLANGFDAAKGVIPTPDPGLADDINKSFR